MQVKGKDADMVSVRYTLRWNPELSELPKKQIGLGVQAALHAIGMHWVKEDLPKHFTNEAMKAYGYTPRQKGYAIAKAKIERSTAPLVGISRGRHKAGLLRATVKSGTRIRATPKSLRVTFEVPSYAMRRSRHGAGPNLPVELTTVSPAEAETFFKIADAAIKEFLAGREQAPEKRETYTS